MGSRRGPSGQWSKRIGRRVRHRLQASRRRSVVDPGAAFAPTTLRWERHRHERRRKATHRSAVQGEQSDEGGEEDCRPAPRAQHGRHDASDGEDDEPIDPRVVSPCSTVMLERPPASIDHGIGISSWRQIARTSPGPISACRGTVVARAPSLLRHFVCLAPSPTFRAPCCRRWRSSSRSFTPRTSARAARCDHRRCGRRHRPVRA